MLDASGYAMINAKRKKLRDDFLYEAESHAIGDACKEIWKQFGSSFKESVIDRALDVAREARGLAVERQKRIDIHFAGVRVGTYVPDKIINDAILLELKCKPFLTKEDEKQFWRYLRASPYRLGFLVNFGPKRLESKDGYTISLAMRAYNMASSFMAFIMASTSYD